MDLFAVSQEQNLEAVADSLLRARTSKANREAAVAKIRAANPGIDLDRLRPGQVLFVPDLEGRKPAADDNFTNQLDEMAKTARDALTALSAEVAVGVTRQKDELRQTFETLDSEPLLRLMEQVPDLKETTTGLRGTLESDLNESARQAAELAEATGRWAEELEALRAML